MLQRLLFTLIMSAALTTIFAGGSRSRAGQTLVSDATLSYRLNPSKWKLEVDPDLPSMGPEHYIFNGDHSIDLNVIPIGDDLQKTLQEKGAAKFVKEAFSGKNRINKMFGVGESQLVDFKLENFQGVEVLQIRAKQQIETEHLLTLEKYYMSGGKAVHIELRWHDTSDSKKQKDAEADLSKIVLRVPASAAP